MKYYNKGIPCETLPNNCCGIYLIKNLINNKIYIGQSVNIKRRIQEHMRSAQPEIYALKSERDSNAPLHRAMNKYGVDNFSINIIEECSQKQLDQEEQKWILLLHSNISENGYNLTFGGQKSFVLKGENHSQAKLTLQQVQQIKVLLKNTQLTLGEISQKYNDISKSTLSMINQGKIWFDENENYPIRSTYCGSPGEKNPSS